MTYLGSIIEGTLVSSPLFYFVRCFCSSSSLFVFCFFTENARNFSQLFKNVTAFRSVKIYLNCESCLSSVFLWKSLPGVVTLSGFFQTMSLIARRGNLVLGKPTPSSSQSEYTLAARLYYYTCNLSTVLAKPKSSTNIKGSSRSKPALKWQDNYSEKWQDSHSHKWQDSYSDKWQDSYSDK